MGFRPSHVAFDDPLLFSYFPTTYNARTAHRRRPTNSAYLVEIESGESLMEGLFEGKQCYYY